MSLFGNVQHYGPQMKIDYQLARWPGESYTYLGAIIRLLRINRV
jgi:hypothetical protein